ncbi:hypothetical protein D3C81_910380 [compost metagenome]
MGEPERIYTGSQIMLTTLLHMIVKHLCQIRQPTCGSRKQLLGPMSICRLPDDQRVTAIDAVTGRSPNPNHIAASGGKIETTCLQNEVTGLSMLKCWSRFSLRQKAVPMQPTFRNAEVRTVFF